MAFPTALCEGLRLVGLLKTLSAAAEREPNILPSVVLRPPLTDGGTSFVLHTRVQIIPLKDTLARKQGSAWLVRVCVYILISV